MPSCSAPQTQLVTDDGPSYQNLPGVRHDAITLGPMAAHIALPWIHRLFLNLKRWGLGVYHGLRKTNLQHYLTSSCSASIGAEHAPINSLSTAGRFLDAAAQPMEAPTTPAVMPEAAVIIRRFAASL
jgi:hypothetical protein